jgi:glycosyltransferase involved in cell wall biosynthesis
MKPRPTIAVVIPAHPARYSNGLLKRALESVTRQTRQPDELLVMNDLQRHGSAKNRNRGVVAANTEWVALLDSDDVLRPDHLGLLVEHATRTGADLVYPWYDKIGAFDIWANRFRRPFHSEALRRGNFIAVTVLVKTRLLLSVGGFKDDLELAPGRSACDEWGTWLRLLDAGARFEHLPEKTWVWHCHRGNTQGLPTRGDARQTMPLDTARAT